MYLICTGISDGRGKPPLCGLRLDPWVSHIEHQALHSTVGFYQVLADSVDPRIAISRSGISSGIISNMDIKPGVGRSDCLVPIVSHGFTDSCVLNFRFTAKYHIFAHGAGEMQRLPCAQNRVNTCKSRKSCSF